jgi:hypothetical protein
MSDCKHNWHGILVCGIDTPVSAKCSNCGSVVNAIDLVFSMADRIAELEQQWVRVEDWAVMPKGHPDANYFRLDINGEAITPDKIIELLRNGSLAILSQEATKEGV